MLGPVLSQCSPPGDQPTSTLPPSLIHQTMARGTQTLGATLEPLYYPPRELRHYQDEFCCNARRRRSACVKRSPSATLIKLCLATTELLEVLSVLFSIFLANSGCALMRSTAMLVANGWLASNAHFQPHSWRVIGRLSDPPSSLKVRNAPINLRHVVNTKDLHLLSLPFATPLDVLRSSATSRR
jgi:hypothetical protein